MIEVEVNFLESSQAPVIPYWDRLQVLALVAKLIDLETEPKQQERLSRIAKAVELHKRISKYL